jgi:hypothetical protein
MQAYGWEWHSDAKARRLWDFCSEIELGQFFDCDPVVELFHDVFRAVHLDRDKCVRRNLPPWDPESTE